MNTYLKIANKIVMTILVSFIVIGLLAGAFALWMIRSSKDPRKILSHFPTDNTKVVYVLHCSSGKYLDSYSDPSLKKGTGISGGVFLGKSVVNPEILCGKKFRGILKVCPENKNCIGKPPNVDILEVTEILGDGIP